MPDSSATPLPEMPVFYLDSSHDVRAGTELDLATGRPPSCECRECTQLRVNRVAVVRREAARRRLRSVASDRAEALRQTPGALECSACGHFELPICPRCNHCTARNMTRQQVVDFMLLRQFDDHSLPEAEALGVPLQTFVGANVSSDCTCDICPICDVVLSRRDGTVCQRGHHLGCSCTCWTCPMCNSMRATAPSGPGRVCPGGCGGLVGCCCHCTSCGECGALQPSSGVRGVYGDLLANRCQSCNRCVNMCCRCIPAEGAVMPVASESRGVVFQRAIMHKWTATDAWGLVEAGVPKPAQLNPFTRLIGAEIECGGNGTTGLNKVVVRKWKGAIVQDGSLPTSGFEINTAPAGGDMFVKQMREIGAEFERTGVWANNSCGLHIHVDCSDARVWDMRRIINLYRRVEPAMFKLLPAYRQDNIYCVPCGPSWWKIVNNPKSIRELKGRLTTALYDKDPNGPRVKTEATRKVTASAVQLAKRGKNNATRYRALNVHSWFLRGTLEFRHGAPSALVTAGGDRNRSGGRVVPDIDYIINWGVLCASVVEAAMHMSDAQVDAMPLDDSMGMLLNILPNDRMRTWAKDTRSLLELAVLAPPTAGPPETEDGPGSPGCGCDDCSAARSTGNEE